MDRSKINDFIKKNRQLSREELAVKCGISENAVQKREQAMGLKRVFVTESQELDAQIYQTLLKSKRAWSLADISNFFDVGIGKVEKAIQELKRQGKNIHLLASGVEISKDIPKDKPSVIDMSGWGKKHYKFGLTADNHLGSKYYRADVLNALFDIWEKQGVASVYQCGNMIDGEASFNKHDLIVHGMQNQVDYFVEHWPKRKGIKTRFITGDDHEGWYVQREGVNIGKLIQMTAEEKGRNDLIYLGHMEHDVILRSTKGQAVMRLIHAGGGSSYATSYSQQKIVESYQGGEKPQILLIGHYHKAEYGYPREVHSVQAGCTEDQTPFMRKKKIQAHVGGWTIEFDQDDNGTIHAFTVQFHAFYDKGFYDAAWKYHW